MITIGSFVKISDNSGALIGQCLNIKRYSIKTGVLPGQFLVLSDPL